jgi:hypothetical protein
MRRFGAQLAPAKAGVSATSWTALSAAIGALFAGSCLFKRCEAPDEPDINLGRLAPTGAFPTAKLVSFVAISRSDNPQRSRLQCRASVNCDLSPCDVTAFIGQQEQNKGRYLFGRSHAFHRDQL